MREIRDISNEAYRALTEFVSVSELKLFDESPYLYKRRYIDKIKTDKKNDSLLLGTLLHSMLLEPDTVADEYHIYTKIDGRTAEGKAQVLELEKMMTKTPVSAQMYEQAQNIVNFSRIKLAEITPHSKLQVEKSFFCNDSLFFKKVPVKARMDSFVDDNFIIDYKTTVEPVSEKNFQSTMLDYKYHWQAAFYLKIYEEITGKKLDKFIWLVQQTIEPFGCEWFEADPVAIKIAEIELQECLFKIKKALKHKDFPRMNPIKNRVISLPRYYVNKYLADDRVLQILQQQGDSKNGT